MLYPQNENSSLSDALFRTPTNEYRGAPFWAWNGKLQKNLLLKEIGQMQEMGMGGFCIHSRKGLTAPYLGREYMQMMKLCYEKARENGMLFWLYDEAGWPSGFAGGYVTQNPEFRTRYLVFAPAGYHRDSETYRYVNSAKATRNSDRKFLAGYRVTLQDGCLKAYHRMNWEETEETLETSGGGDVWEAWLEVSADTERFNHQAYVDTMNRKATESFLRTTHERFFQEFGGGFGNTVPAVFTDEPQVCAKGRLAFPEQKAEILLPYTDDFDASYEKKYRIRFLDILPEVIWELPEGKRSVARYFYHDHICERFASAYCDTIGAWCRSHNIMLTGHLLGEGSLYSQTRSVGEVMRPYRAFQLPGIDILSARFEFVTAKQAQSAARQYGRPGVICEIYGATGWNFRFQDYKLSGDWLAALGVTTRVHHLNWLTMAGEGKRDYPACIGYQSPWYREYSLIEDHFSRLNTALTRGKPLVRVGVIHPVESYWLHWGPDSQTSEIRDDLETNFESITEWLLFGQIDFDFICESLLPSQAGRETEGCFPVGEMNYQAVVIPACETLRRTTVERLENFREKGGKIIFMGEPPSLMDAVPTDRIRKLAEHCETVSFCRHSILQALESARDIDIQDSSGARADRLFYQMRVDSKRRWLFLSHVKPPDHPEISAREDYAVTVRGKWLAKLYDTLNGDIRWIPAEIQGNKTVLRVSMYAYDSLLICFLPDDDASGVPDLYPGLSDASVSMPKSGGETVDLPDADSFQLSEPNVCLLDQAEYSLDGLYWEREEEILRIDRAIRKRKSWPEWNRVGTQPWEAGTAAQESETGFLRFQISSEVEIPRISLAVEPDGLEKISLNGTEVPVKPSGWFVDESIRKISLPPIPTGRSILTLKKTITPYSGLEWCYLLGKFGVSVLGRHTRLRAFPDNLYWGSWVSQGLPFYSGNVTYCKKFRAPSSDVWLCIPHFQGALLSVELDGKQVGKIAFPPDLLRLGTVCAGKHVLKITLFGNRNNAFGAVHLFDPQNTWNNPGMWYRSGPSWSYEYQLKDMGILSAPQIRFFPLPE